jgi:formylglycine-generating enzyme required for sulfatase activity
MKIGEYTITDELKTDAIYRWVEALNCQENQVILQILQRNFPSQLVEALLAHFDTVQTIRRKEIWAPVQTFSSSEYRLVVVYPYLNATSLEQALQTNQENAIRWWQQASETLHILHNKNLVYGYVNLDSFAVIDGDLSLGGFGYMPLLELGERNTLEKWREVLAPEVLERQQLTPAADIYSFAKMIASWQPEITATQWYSQATDFNPNNRFRKIRDAFAVLEETLKTLTPNKSILIPKYHLQVRVEPQEAGTIIGGNKHLLVNTITNVTANATHGWRFVRWSGDLSSTENQLTVKMDTDKTLIAHFTKELSTEQAEQQWSQQIEKLKAELLLAENRALKFENQAIKQETELIQAKNQAKQLENELAQAKNQAKQLDNELAQAKNQARQLETELAQAKNQARQLETELAQIKKVLAKAEEERQQKEKEQKTFSFETVKVNSSGQIIKREQHQAQYFTEKLGNNIALEMVHIPGGKFLMGAPSGEKDSRNSQRPQHQVNVPPFWMGKYPVTQAQWRAVASLPRVEQELEPDPSKFKGNDHPVEQVSWLDAVEFCQRLSRAIGKDYRLPSEAEWEYACRARTTTPFYFGETITTDIANYDGNYTYAQEQKGQYRKKTTPVGSFPPNGFGLYDLHGNVWEWCADNWHNNYEGAPTDGRAWLDKNENQYQVLRGGSWNYFPDNCRSAYRYYDIRRRVNINYNIGFRVACGGGRAV